MAEVGSAFVSILPSTRGFGAKLSGDIDGEVATAGKSAGSKFGTALKVGALAAIGGAVFVGKFLGGALGEAREAAVIGARTENVIKSMGNAAKISAEDVGKMAGRISALTGVDDEMIQSGQNMLLTFGNISNEVDGKFTGTFDRATALMVDMSRAMGTDTKGAAIQLGKALNDPIRGVSAMARSGVSFTEQQKEQIKTLQESGDILGAQNIILGEVEKQFGGAAAAMATPADRLETTYGNLKEQIGTALIPVADRFLNMLLSAAPTVSAAIAGIGPAFQQIQTFLAPFVAQITGLFGGGSGGGLFASIGSFAQSIATQMLPVLQTMGQTFVGTVLPAVQRFGQYLASNLFPIFQQVAGIIRGQVVPILVSLGQFVYGTVYPAVIALAQSIATKLRPVFDALTQFVRGSLLPTIQQLLVKFREYQPTIQQVITVVGRIIATFAQLAATILSKVLPPILQFAGFLLRNAVPAVAGTIGVLVKVISTLIDVGQAFINGVKKVVEFQKAVVEKVAAVIRAVAEIPGKVSAALGDLGSYLYNKGRELIQGLIDGIKSMVGAVGDAIGGVASKIKGYLPGSPVKEGPLTSWNNGGAGKRLMELLAGGITASETKVAEAMAKVLDKVVAVAQEKMDKAKSVVESLKSSFDSLSSSVAQAFTGDLFGAETGRDFLSGLVSGYNNLRAVTDAFGVLREWGIPSSFLARLFASGNTGLILDLAKDQGMAQSAVNILGGIDKAAAGLGDTVARDEFGKELREANRELREIKQNTRALQTLSRDLGQALNAAVAAGQRSAAPAGAGGGKGKR